MNADMMRWTNLRIFIAAVRGGLADEKALAVAKDHYGLPPEATTADLMESLKDDADAAFDQVKENLL